MYTRLILLVTALAAFPAFAQQTSNADQAAREIDEFHNFIKVHQFPGAAGSYLTTFSATQSRPGTYLGVGIEAPSEQLRAHLKLPEGVGLIVNHIADDSAAKRSGVKVHDVLQKLDDQLLVNAEQFVTLIRLKKPGDSISITLLREARPMTLSATLGEKVANEDQERKYTDTLELANATLAGISADLAATQISQYMKKSDLVARSFVVGPMTLDDGENVIVVTKAGDGSMIVVNKESGKVVFEGPIKTEEQWNAVPESIRRKLELLKTVQPSNASDYLVQRLRKSNDNNKGDEKETQRKE